MTVGEINLSNKLIAFTSNSTNVGGAGGSSIVCSVLATMPDYNGQVVVISGGTYKGQSRVINGTTTGGVITPDKNFGGQIVAGVEFTIVGTEMAGVTDLEQAIIAHTGVTTAIGNVGGTSIIDSGLIGYGVGTYVGFILEIYYNDTTKVDAQVITTFDNATGEVTVDTAFKGGQVPALVKYNVLVPSPTTAPTAKAKEQILETTIDLNQIAGDYDLFTGSTAAVLVEDLVITMPNAVAAGALTSISIQTNDATPQSFVDNVAGAVAFLTAENQIGYAPPPPIRIGVGKKIQLTIAGGATGVAYVCTISVKIRATADGGTLTP